MDYQLVIKFWRKSLPDQDAIAAIQGDLKDALGDSAALDGYDVHAKEIHLFVVTPNPKHSFRRIKTVLIERGIGSEENTSELPSLIRISYAVFCLKNKQHHHRSTK